MVRSLQKNTLMVTAMGFGLFAIAFGLINSELLIHSILYRVAANDYASAMRAFAFIAAQSILFLLLVICLPKRFFWLLIAGVTASAIINISYADILGEVVDSSTIAWMIGEARQSTNAAGQFAGTLIVSAVKLGAALALLIGARHISRPLAGSILPEKWRNSKFALIISIAALGLFFAAPVPGSSAVTSERNALVYAVEVWRAAPPPPRAELDVKAETDQQIEKIIWLVDESISYDVFKTVIKPQLADFNAIDFGRATALGNCSTPANVALRSGVNVATVNGSTDLRTTPSIWQYARAAGYRTILADGQVSGPPQNMLLEPERALIDEYRSLADGLDTDRKIAGEINSLLKSPDKIFAYVVLRGVHFQYTDHYPGGAADKKAPLIKQYHKAVQYSKKGIFERLLEGVDGQKVAIIYTSDHGQNLKPGALPHCSSDPGSDELSIPLAAFLPEKLVLIYRDHETGARSASQIFPTSLGWMGYSVNYAEKQYDNGLLKPSKKPVWFGRNVVPVDPSDQIDVNIIPAYQAGTSK